MKEYKTKKINSHIQMPKLLLKRFENENGSFYYYDVKKNIIGDKGHAKSMNTKLGYYSQYTEDFLSENVERNFSEVLQSIDKTDFDSSGFPFEIDLQKKTKTFIYSLLSRDPRFEKEIQKNSAFFRFHPETNRHDLAVETGIRLFEEGNFLDSYFLTFTINKSQIPYILPVCGFYSYDINGYKHLTLPVSPEVAITLMEENGKEFLVKNNVISMYRFDSEDYIHRLNGFAFKAQCDAGWGYVISSSRAELEFLLSQKMQH